MNYQSKIIKIGEDVELFLDEKMLIIFNDTVPEELVSISVIHDHKTMASDVSVENKFVIGDETYKVLAVGDKANETLHELGHCTIRFGEPSTEDLPGTIVVEDKNVTSIEVGNSIGFK